MKSPIRWGALSARQGATDQMMNRMFSIAKYGIPMLVLAILISSCHEKTNGQSAMLKKTAPDSLAKPKIDIKVNKRYDEKGNLIGFDSTYSSYYSNISGDTAQMDSLMGSFDRYFRREHSTFFGRQFDPLFFNDSTRYPDFFHDDFFMKRYELNDLYMRDMMHRMDSIKNNFYKERRRLENKPKT
jgi:hypothetical protein